ncbi:MAG: hypothetical protein AB8B69_26485, partial [Chitinophagales bacterium]
MRKKNYPLVFVLIILSISLFGFVHQQYHILPDYKKSQSEAPEVIEGVIVVKLQKSIEVSNYESLETSDPQFNQLLKKYRISSLEAVFPKGGESGLVKGEEMARLHFLKFTHATAPQILASDFSKLRTV